MKTMSNEHTYKAAMARIEELLPLVNEDTPIDDKNLADLEELAGLTDEYENKHYVINKPTFIETIKLRMYEMGLTQSKLSQLLGVSPSRISDYLNGKREPTLKVARDISKKLNIDANIVLNI